MEQIFNFKHIHIGKLIQTRVLESGIDIHRICNFMSCTVDEIQRMYTEDELPSGVILKWCKLLKYDFFRIYSQHIILYSPPGKMSDKVTNESTEVYNLPLFKKNIYTTEIIDFVLEQIKLGRKTKEQVIDEYKIPKTTLYKWISKYSK
ncbi:transposase [Chryseobacterium sp. OSA05B]|uniref:transposase n=1 Tax=Chryseobacterium sp. OSA05B TaxID=2862650 RepID=UPI001CBCD9A3|nr:transposase [Chryseobacterium sp. OSA05B]